MLCSKTAAETVMDLAYQIVVAHNGCEALQILRESHKIDLLFSGIVMPGGTNGVQLALKLGA
jgi:CheY-like chemotaxis protein